jgi:phosphoglycerate dehydrogenase-like enzyme
MKPTSVIVNCSRGGIINEEALYKALKNNQILGAGLDVFVQEPVNMDNPLLTLNNVVLMPHNAGTTAEGKNKVVGAAVQNVIEFIEGKVPHGIKNPEVLK